MFHEELGSLKPFVDFDPRAMIFATAGHTGTRQEQNVFNMCETKHARNEARSAGLQEAIASDATPNAWLHASGRKVRGQRAIMRK